MKAIIINNGPKDGGEGEEIHHGFPIEAYVEVLEECVWLNVARCKLLNKLPNSDQDYWVELHHLKIIER